jgi:hypothetical protein
LGKRREEQVEHNGATPQAIARNPLSLDDIRRGAEWRWPRGDGDDQKHPAEVLTGCPIPDTPVNLRVTFAEQGVAGQTMLCACFDEPETSKGSKVKIANQRVSLPHVGVHTQFQQGHIH